MCAREIRKGTFNVHKKHRERRPPVRTSRHRKEGYLAVGRGVETVGPIDGVREKKNHRPCIPTLHCDYDQIPILVHF